MSRNINIVCDRCGKELINPITCYCSTHFIKDYSARLTLWGVGEPRSTMGQRIDLCQECYEEFVNFMELKNS